MMAGRISTLDVAKGLGILYVPFYHVCFVAEPGMYIGEVGGCLLLGFFFLVSGYGFDPDQRSFLENVRHRARTLLVPTFCWLTAAAVAMCVFYAAVEGEGPGYLVQSILLTVFRPELMSLVAPGQETYTSMFNTLSPVWFVWTLFLADIVVLAIGKRALENGRNTALACIILLAASACMLEAGLRLPWNFQCVPAYAALILIGAAVYRALQSGGLMWARKARVPLIAASAIGMVAVCCIAPSCKLFMGGLGTLGGINAFTFCLGSVLFTIVFIEGVAKPLDLVPLARRALSWLGRRTLAILVIHGPIAVMIAHLIDVPAKLETLVWSADSYPWTELGGAPIQGGSVVVYLLTVAACVGVLWLYDVVRARIDE